MSLPATPPSSDLADVAGRPGSSAPPPDDTRTQPSAAAKPAGRRWVAPLALVLTIGFVWALVALHVGAYPQFSPLDEPAHADYVFRMLDGEVPAAGDHLTPETLRAMSCRGIETNGPGGVALPPCDGPHPIEKYPGWGYNTAYVHSPAYYAITAGLTWLLEPLPGDTVDHMRLTGALWLGLAIVLMWLILRDLGVGWPVRMALGVALAAVPVVLHAHSTVNNDATALAIGAAMVLAALRWDRGRLNVAWLAALAAVAMLLKSTNLAIVLAVAVFVIARAIQRRAPGTSTWRSALGWRPLSRAAAVGVGAAVGGAVWLLIYPRLAIADPRILPSNWTYLKDSFAPSWLAEQLAAFTSPLHPQAYDEAVAGGIAMTVANVANVGILALAVVGAVTAQTRGPVRALAAATAVVMVAYGPILVVINYVAASSYFTPMPARYGLSLVPALLAVGATALRSRPAQVGVTILALTAWGAMVARLLAG